MKNFQKIIFAISCFLFLLVMPMQVFAKTDSGSCGKNLTWTLSEDGVLTISGSGEMDDYLEDFIPTPWKSYQERVYRIVIEDGVTGIGNWAFLGFSNLEEIDIPSTVVRIGTRAFVGCESLQSVVINEGITEIEHYAFQGCESLTKVVLPSTVTNIGWGAFAFCESLKEIVLGENVTTIETDAFSGCESLEKIVLPPSVTEIGEGAFDDCSSLKTAGAVGGGYHLEFSWTEEIPDNAFMWFDFTQFVIPDGIKRIGACAFFGCESLESIKIPDSVISVGSDAFACCYSLTNIEFSKNMTEIPYAMFVDCDSLTSISIPEGITSIGESAFEECDSLVSVEISGTVENIGTWAFSKCWNLQQVILKEGVTSIGNVAFYGCYNLTKIVIPSSVTEIGEGAFDGCDGLQSAGPVGGGYNLEFSWTADTLPGNAFSGSGVTEVVLPQGITNIPEGMFSYCAKLETIELPDSVTSIGDRAFYACESLADINLSNHITYIGEYAFAVTGLTNVQIPNSITKLVRTFEYCANLTEVKLPNSIVEIGEGTFSGCTSLETIELPNSVTIIGEYAFFKCEGLLHIEIPNRVKTIDENAFAWCYGLESVTIPKSVTWIGESAFETCVSLNEVYYSGTEKEWSLIYIGYYNDYLENATIHFNVQGSDENDVKVTDVFHDVFVGDWFVDSVQFVYDNGMMSGSDGSFKPNDNMTRAMIVTTLYRLAGEPVVTDYTAINKFSDVYADMWYTNAVCWAYNTGVTTGYPDRGMFGTDDSVTREQLATFLYRYAENRGLSTTERGDLSTLLNADKVNSYAEDAIQWAVGIGLISGLEFTQNGVKVYDLAPQNTATRAQMATILMRFCNYLL